MSIDWIPAYFNRQTQRSLVKEFVSGSSSLKGYLRGDGFCYFGHWKQKSGVLNPDDNHLLFDQLESWLRGFGKKITYGPIDESTLYNYRLRIDSFDRPVFWGEPDNQRQATEFLSGRGFEIAEKFYSYEFSDIEKVKVWAENFLTYVPSSILADLQFIPLTKDLWLDRGEDFCALANHVFSENFAFRNVDYTDFKRLYHGPAIQIIDFETSTVVMSSKSELVGCALNLWDPQNPGVLLLKTLGVLPAYRKMGATFFELIRQMCLRNKSYHQAILCLMKEGNLPSTVLREFSNHVRTYGLFSKRL